MELNHKNVKLILLIICAGFGIYVGLQNLNLIFDFLGKIFSAFTPLIIGLVFAFVLNVPLQFFERKLFKRKDGKPLSPAVQKAKRPVCILLSVIVMLGIIALVLFLIIPELIGSITLLFESMPETINNVQKWATSILEDNPQLSEFIKNTAIDWTNISNTALKYIQDFAMNFLSQTFGVISSVITIIVNVGLGFIFSIYFLAKKEKLSSQFKKLTYAFLPEKKADTLVSIGRLTCETFSHSVVGTLIECTIIGSLTVLCMTIFGFPYAPMIGVLIAMMALIPMFGITIGIIVGALIILTVSPVQALWFIVMMVIIQQVEGNLIYPRVASSQVGLPALWVMTAVVVSGSLFGFIAMLVCVPVASVIYTLIRRAVHVRIRHRKIPHNKFEQHTKAEAVRVANKPKDKVKLQKGLKLSSLKNKNSK